MKSSLLILAAGIGSRYGRLKQMDKFGPSGEAIIDYTIFDAIRAGFKKVVFVISKSMENEFKEIFAKKFRDKIEVQYVFQKIEDLPSGVRVPPGREKPWGTAHAVLVAAPEIKEPFAVLNADDFYGADSIKVLFSFLSNLNKEDNSSYCIVGYRLSDTLSEYGHVSRGICEQDKGGYLKSIVEKTQISKTEEGIVYQDEGGSLVRIKGDAIVSMNLMGFTPSIFSHLKSYFEKFIRKHSQNLKAELYLPTVVNEIIKTNIARMKILNTDDNWFGVTYREDKDVVTKKIEDLIDKGIYPKNLWH